MIFIISSFRFQSVFEWAILIKMSILLLLKNADWFLQKLYSKIYTLKKKCLKHQALIK